ncbi:hypothetical protein DYB32_008466, partial [Aphanomyces invadans]
AMAVMASVGITLAYMTILDSYVQNDYFWTHFNETGAQTFVADVFNAQLWTAAPGPDGRPPLDLFSIDVAIAKDYSAPHTSTTIQASRNRRIATEELHDIAFAIPALRAQSIRKSARSLTCPCWLDFDRRWEVAYTTKRQRRCHARYADNGAAYLEAMLRNTDWTKWYIMWGSGFEAAYGGALRELLGGAAWLEQTTTALATTAVDAEIEWWTRHNVSRYTIAWHNHYEIGFDDSVILRNAVSTFSIPLHHVVSQEGLWTSYLASAGLWNGCYFAVEANVSLVRGASNSLHSRPDAVSPELWTGGYPDTAWSVLLHDTVGPIGSIDILYVQPPRAFLDLHSDMSKALLLRLQDSSVPSMPAPTHLDMVPTPWRKQGMLFAGGNPLCYTGATRLYVQQSIGFDDGCIDPYPPMAVDATSFNTILALWLVEQSHGNNASHADMCLSTGSHAQPACNSAISLGRSFLANSMAFSTLEASATSISQAVQAVEDLHVELMQYASYNGTPLVLRQSLLDKHDLSWSFFGWLHLLDWAQGVREVLAIEGDEATMVLISKQYAAQSFVADPLATPMRFAFALWVLLWYMNVVMFAVVMLAVASAVPSKLPWRHWMVMHRVAGVVWIGRPLLILRGLTAMALLSTSKVQLVAHHGFTSLAVTPRSAWETCVIAGEAVWLTYSINDILSLATGMHTLRCGVINAGLVWTFYVVLDLLHPVMPSVSTRRRCVSHNMEVQMSSVGARRYRHQARAVAGLTFLVASVASSASFIVVTKAQFTNNFLWQGFNSSGMQAFLVDWYNLEVVFRSEATLLDDQHVHLQALYNGTATTVSTSQFASNTVQFDRLSLAALIAGLQTTAPCDLPWVATQFCWVDFRRRWQVANSVLRQRRCDRHMPSNGAVYMEALFRNTDMARFTACWGDALDVGLFRDLRQTWDGHQWIRDVFNAPLRPADELLFWAAHNITTFTVQWQNYKSIGLVETLVVQSALGMSYPLTMKTSNGTFRFDLETSRKMYWGWGGDLWAITNTTMEGPGASLIRSSATFAFRNDSIESVLARNDTISLPLDPGLSLVRSVVGPFGSTDMFHVGCPEPVLRLVRAFLEVDHAALLTHDDAQVDVSFTSDVMKPIPTAWQRYSESKGGNILCPAIVGSGPLPSGMIALLTMYMSCGAYVMEVFPLTRRGLAFSSIAWGGHLKCPSGGDGCAFISDACSNITTPSTTCKKSFLAVLAWTKEYMSRASQAALFQSSQEVKQGLLDMQLEVVQYAQLDESSPLELLRAPLFDPADPHFELVAWQIVFEWAMGFREVVSFQGDVGTMNIVSTYQTYTSTQPNPLEIPTNVAFYCMLCLQYTTAVIFVVTLITIVYIAASKGRVEGLNMMKVNRVAGIVWVGRPLLCLRSLVAILLLATSSPRLEQSGTFTTLAKRASDEWVATLFSGSEACWLVIVITDVGMAATRDLTNKYSWNSTVAVAALATLLSMTYPVEPTFILHRTCTTPQVNFQVECCAGVVQIGSLARVVQLVLLTSVVIVLCYVWQRWRRPQFRLPHHTTSHLLPAGALYLYNKQPWIVKSTLYLDKASAFLCGLIAVSYNRSMYVLDVKMWRVHVIAIDSAVDLPPLAMNSHLQRSIASAVPLIN